MNTRTRKNPCQSTPAGAAAGCYVTFALFALRVLAQAIQRFVPQSFLPPFNAFQGSRLPYPPLLSAQVAIVQVVLPRVLLVLATLAIAGQSVYVWYRTYPVSCKIYNSIRPPLCPIWESSMSDVHVYYFLVWDRMAGEKMLFARPATLAAIAGKGEPVLESRIVVDHTELDAGGFLSANVGDERYPFGTPSRDRFVQ